MHSIDHNWQRWIAENLLLDATAENIQAMLVAHGFDAQEAQREIEAALASPYFQGGTRLRNRLRKRDWILSVYREQQRARTNAGTVMRHEKLPREVFFEEYYHQNRPVIITGMFDDWPARKKWSLDYFRAQCGTSDVEVQFGRDTDASYEINQMALKRNMRLNEFIDLIEQSGPTNNFYLTANNTLHNRLALAPLWQDTLPIHEYLDTKSPDTGFFWLGPAGTRTPFHHDLTNNFMTQIVGRKRVTLVPLCDTPFMYNLTHCYSQVDGKAIDYNLFPDMRHAQLIECTLQPGELLFVPIGWWHYVEALDTSVTITYTNFLIPNVIHSQYTSYQDV
ncbi:cupin-like domain-containing protein [Paraburkholderia bonniea]|uniref:cupin-like domain-containing protein n=1 Tax=Paraburkholderia bonniea TaxID=2152891 RepID=UPI001291B615|nr:cupin-like domain-containing protein [Paraburkholderia bonniea]WJF90193.1 cupin-like domain-containing protein [Paraburkholderia bonniea]WJF93507.1 cupin-like domain-containing protein [Paraburkholderia bonniea]